MNRSRPGQPQAAQVQAPSVYVVKPLDERERNMIATNVLPGSEPNDPDDYTALEGAATGFGIGVDQTGGLILNVSIKLPKEHVVLPALHLLPNQQAMIEALMAAVGHQGASARVLIKKSVLARTTMDEVKGGLLGDLLGHENRPALPPGLAEADD